MPNKYTYKIVIQQNYSPHGWEDVSEYECNSTGGKLELSDKLSPKGKKETLYAHDLREYKLMGYPTRAVLRKELKSK